MVKYLNQCTNNPKMARGRPIGSKVRQNIVEILGQYGKLHGYAICTIYRKIFPKVTMRAIYYHLKKGVQTGELKVSEVRKEKGNYSWGGEVERIYYALGEKAKPVGSEAVKEHAKNEVAKKQ